MRKGVALSPDGNTAYVLVRGGITVFDVGADGALSRRGQVEVDSKSLQDVALTPNGKNLCITSRDGRVLQFDVDASGNLEPKTDPAVETRSGRKAIGIAIVPDGSAAYVSTQAGNGSQRLFAFAIGADGALSPGVPPSLPLTASSSGI